MKKITNPKDYALFLLQLRDRTENEIKEKMKLKGFDPEAIEKTVDFLREKKFLDDERFVTNFIKNKQECGSSGKYKIKLKLQRLGVDNKLIEQKLSEIDSKTEEIRAMGLAVSWLAKKQSVPVEKKYEKLGRHLISRGYDISIVKDVLRKTLK